MNRLRSGSTRRASVFVSVQSFSTGDALPRVCVIDGVQADRMYQRRALSPLPFWFAPLAMIAGPLVLLLDLALPGGVSGWIPMSDAAELRLIRLNRLRIGLFLGFFVSLGAYSLWRPSVFEPVEILLRALSFVAFAGICVASVLIGRQFPRMVLRGSEVEIVGAHLQFVEAAKVT